MSFYLKLFLITSLVGQSIAVACVDVIAGHHDARRTLFNTSSFNNTLDQAASEINGHSDIIREILVDKSRVDTKRHATTDEKGKILKAVMAERFIAKKMQMTLSSATTPAVNPYAKKGLDPALVGHFKILELTWVLAEEMADFVSSKDYPINNRNLYIEGLVKKEKYRDLHRLLSVDASAYNIWLNEMYVEHFVGLISSSSHPGAIEEISKLYAKRQESYNHNPDNIDVMLYTIMINNHLKHKSIIQLEFTDKQKEIIYKSIIGNVITNLEFLFGETEREGTYSSLSEMGILFPELANNGASITTDSHIFHQIQVLIYNLYAPNVDKVIIKNALEYVIKHAGGLDCFHNYYLMALMNHQHGDLESGIHKTSEKLKNLHTRAINSVEIKPLPRRKLENSLSGKTKYDSTGLQIKEQVTEAVGKNSTPTANPSLKKLTPPSESDPMTPQAKEERVSSVDVDLQQVTLPNGKKYDYRKMNEKAARKAHRERAKFLKMNREQLIDLAQFDEEKRINDEDKYKYLTIDELEQRFVREMEFITTLNDWQAGSNPWTKLELTSGLNTKTIDAIADAKEKHQDTVKELLELKRSQQTTKPLGFNSPSGATNKPKRKDLPSDAELAVVSESKRLTVKWPITTRKFSIDMIAEELRKSDEIYKIKELMSYGLE